MTTPVSSGFEEVEKLGGPPPSLEPLNLTHVHAHPHTPCAEPVLIMISQHTHAQAEPVLHNTISTAMQTPTEPVLIIHCIRFLRITEPVLSQSRITEPVLAPKWKRPEPVLW